MTDNQNGKLTIEDLEAGFSAALADQGYGDHHVPADGEFHRFAFPDNSSGKKSGSAKLVFNARPEGVVFDWRRATRRSSAGSRATAPPSVSAMTIGLN